MKLPAWLFVLLLAGYTAWSVNYWHCYKCQCCADAPAAESKPSGAPLFKWEADQPLPDTSFAAWKKALLARGGQGDTLSIVGLYHADEKNATKNANLGMARAAALAALMQPEMPAARVRISAKTTTEGLAPGGNPVECAEFAWLKMVLKKEESAVIETDNAAIFLFPFNSTEKDHDPKVDEYLLKLVEKHKASATTFTIVGHTDDVGTPEENAALGLARANTIRQILVQNGIAASRIQAASKGETEPVADNANDDGRHQNRRVVLTVNR